MRATATAPSNIALVKYWGKRSTSLNVPDTGSISVTLAGLETTTTASVETGLTRDVVTIGGGDWWRGRGTRRPVPRSDSAGVRSQRISAHRLPEQLPHGSRSGLVRVGIRGLGLGV